MNMTNTLGEILGVKEHQNVRLTTLGWGILVGVVWTLIGVIALGIYAMPDFLEMFLLAGFVDQVSMVFLGPGFFILVVFLLVWIATIGDLYKVYDVKDDGGRPEE